MSSVVESSSRDRATGKRKPVAGPKSSDLSIDNSTEAPSTSTISQTKKNKPKPFTLLNRTRSINDEEDPKTSPPIDADMKTLQPLSNAPPPQANEKYREMPPTSVRQRSEDRRPGMSREGSQGRENTSRHQPSFSTTGHSFLSNLRGTAVKGAGALSKGLFGKSGRSASTNEREPVIDDEHYVVKVLNLGLVEQTRLTRISKRLESSRDKTEFWMPAFPWRAIDYLNYKGSEVEGLYRVPGSAHEIKKWQRRFDEGNIYSISTRKNATLTYCRARYRSFPRKRSIRHQHHRIHAEIMVTRITRTDSTKALTRSCTTRSSRSRVCTRRPGGRVVKSTTFQLLPALCHHMPSITPARPRREE